MPIRNRNLKFGKITDDSRDVDKYFQLPAIDANTNAATAATTIDGSLYWDDENDKLYCCKGGAWKEVTVAS